MIRRFLVCFFLLAGLTSCKHWEVIDFSSKEWMWKGSDSLLLRSEGSRLFFIDSSFLTTSGLVPMDTSIVRKNFHRLDYELCLSIRYNKSFYFYSFDIEDTLVKDSSCNIVLIREKFSDTVMHDTYSALKLVTMTNTFVHSTYCLAERFISAGLITTTSSVMLPDNRIMTHTIQQLQSDIEDPGFFYFRNSGIISQSSSVAEYNKRLKRYIATKNSVSNFSYEILTNKITKKKKTVIRTK